MALGSFIFSDDARTGAMSYDELKRRQAIAAALLRDGSDAGAPRNVGEGLNAVGKALAYRVAKGKAGEGEKLQEQKQKSIWDALGGAMGGAAPGTGFGTATGAISDASPTPSGTMSASIPSGERASYIRSGLVSRGLPEHVADGFLANFQDESGLDPGINEKNPTVPGSRGGFGLYQLTGPRRQQYETFASQRGVDPSDTDAQLDFLVDELHGSEKKAGARILSAPDTATAAQAIVNDFLRPAPEHRNARAARYAGLTGASQDEAQALRAAYAPQGAPVQVASLDPAAGVAQATAPVGGNVLAPPGSMSPEDQARYNERIRGSQPNPASVVPAGAARATIDDASRMTDFPAAGAPTRQPMPQGGAVMDDPNLMKSAAVAQALGIPGQDQSQEMSPVAAALQGGPAAPPAASDQWAGMRVADAGGQPQQMAQAPQQQPPQRGVNGVSPQALLGILSDPWASPQQREIAQSLLQQQMKPNEYGFQSLPDGTILRTDPRTGSATPIYRGREKPIEVNGRLVDPTTGKVIQDFSDRKTTTVNGVVVDLETGQPIYEGPRDPVNLPAGNVLVSPDGRRLADNPKAPDAPSGYRATPNGLEPIPGGPADPRAPAAPKPGSGFDNEQGLRKEYTAAPEVKEYADIRSSYERLRASAQTGSGPGDLGVIFGYMKMLDPGSVVREGEFATAETAQGVPDYVMNTYNRLLTGERLSPEQRQSFVGAATDLYGTVEKKMQGINQRFGTIAQQYGIDPSRVIQPLPVYEPLKLGDPKASAPVSGSATPAAAPAPAPVPMPPQAPPVAPARTNGGRAYQGGVRPAPQPAPAPAPPPGNYRWNPATKRMEPV